MSKCLSAVKHKAPFPWFGGKSRAAHLVWPRFGDVPNYVEPFFGSGACMFLRPHSPRLETINDLDGFVANFWRAVKLNPALTAEHADNPVNENDLHARHSWLVARRETLTARLEGDPEYYDAKIAGWWVWGLCCWIGSGWCSGAGPWHVVDGLLVKSDTEATGKGVNRQLVHLQGAGQGVNRKRVHLWGAGQGVNRKLVHLEDYFKEISSRLRDVRVCCGSWDRVCGETPTTKQGLTGVMLDPPYADTADRDADIYAVDSLSVAHDVRRWALENGSNKQLRIALCGYEGEHSMPADWECVEWKAGGGYGRQNESNKNAARERIWFSPHCLKLNESLF